MALSTIHLQNCIRTLAASLAHLQATATNAPEYDIFRNAVIKSFELALETSGKLLRKALKLYHSNPAEVDALVYKDVLRDAAKHGLLEESAVIRWFQYRDNRNTTAHDYNEAFAEETVQLLPDFIMDAKTLQHTLEKQLGQSDA